MKLFSSKRRVVAAAAVILLALFLLRPGASRLKSRIASSISMGVGRPVEIGVVHFRLLPRPGFDLDNLVVYDDPAFGAEPMLRASEVTADLRLMSLVRGRLEIARLDLTEPSLNLVHSQDGRWNLEALLERSAHIPLAPTAKPKSEPRPGFPYIEATSARINFKSGPEKKAYALTDADFSLWQDSENAWGVRLRAQPVRTDLNLNDTGLLQVNGTWQRAASLADTPLRVSLEWNRAQLGQFTKLFTGKDQGWRGGIQLDATLTGTPASLQVTSDAAIQDFRRYDITSGEALRLAAHCDGKYSSLDHAFHELACRAPVGSGLIALKGHTGLPGSHNYGLVLTAERVPASAAVALAQRAKSNLPDDLKANGTIGASLVIEENAAARSRFRFEGRGEIADFRLSSVSDKTEIGPETVPLLLTAGDSFAIASSAKKSLQRSAQSMRAPQGPHMELGPFSLGAGHAGAPTARGWISRGSYDISVTGEAEIARALRLARMFGVPALQSTAEGAAQVDLQIAGSLAGRGSGSGSGFLGPQITGSAKLRNVRAAVRGAGGSVEISSAEMQLSPDEVRIEKLIAKAAGTAWTGTVEIPRGCGTPDACEVHFVLSANQIALGELHEWASPRPKERPWYRVLESSGPVAPAFLASLRATGRVTTDRLQMPSLAATHVSAKVTLDRGKVAIPELNADLLGGKHHGEWQADFRVKPAVCHGSGSLTGVSLARLADAMKDAWIAGTATATYEVKGSYGMEFWQSAEGTLLFDVRDGSLARIALGEDAAPLKLTRFTGEARLDAGKLEIRDAKLDSPGGKFQLSGTASLKRELDFKLAPAANGAAATAYAIGGTLASPRVTAARVPETQARLKR